MASRLIQYRPTVAEIDLGAFRHNYKQAHQLIPEGEFLCPIIKANAYGHGALMCSRILQEMGVPAMGVATLEEGIELREAGIKTEIIILDGLLGGASAAFPGLSPAPSYS